MKPFLFLLRGQKNQGTEILATCSTSHLTSRYNSDVSGSDSKSHALSFRVILLCRLGRFQRHVKTRFGLFLKEVFMSCYWQTISAWMVAQENSEHRTHRALVPAGCGLISQGPPGCRFNHGVTAFRLSPGLVLIFIMDWTKCWKGHKINMVSVFKNACLAAIIN